MLREKNKTQEKFGAKPNTNLTSTLSLGSLSPVTHNFLVEVENESFPLIQAHTLLPMIFWYATHFPRVRVKDLILGSLKGCKHGGDRMMSFIFQKFTDRQDEARPKLFAMLSGRRDAGSEKQESD